MIMKRNITRWKKYILGFVIAIFMLLCFGQQRVQAAITRENTQDGFSLVGQEPWMCKVEIHFGIILDIRFRQRSPWITE